uniref:Centrosomal protein of 70 kDa n=1 Tax=Cyclopterus lumpus TaxID=8103 RepID=A0A8C2X1W2_CYCLU
NGASYVTTGQEQVQWDDVNTLLQHRGFKPVHFADPVENKNIPDLVLLDKKSAGEIRMTLRTMLTDSERRQALIQELVKSNNQLKEEAREHTSRAARQSQRATELEGLLDLVRTRVQDLEDRYLGKAAQQHDHTQRLQQDEREARKQSQALEQKLTQQREEAARLQRKLYFTIKEEERRLARQSHAFQHICNRVSRQNSAADQQVLDVIDFYETDRTQLLEELRYRTLTSSSSPQVSVGHAPAFLSKAYQEQQKGSTRRMEALKREVQQLKRELETRCSQLLNDIRAVVTNPSAPLRLHRQRPSSAGLDLAEFQTFLPTLEVWAQQCSADSNSSMSVRVEDMLLLVDTMLENTSAEDEKVLRSPTRHTLGSMVSHFQKLFDVTSLTGVYPRMNEVYGRLGVMTNSLRNLRDVLQLDSRVSPAEVVNQVARLVSSTEHPAGIQRLLGDADIDSIIVKVKQHEEFFPAFHALTVDILHTLGVSLLDDILPALKSLKQTAQRCSD